MSDNISPIEFLNYNYSATKKFENALNFLKNKELDPNDLTFPFVIELFDIQGIIIYGTFSKSLFEKENSTIFININIICIAENHYNEIIQNKINVNVYLSNFNFSHTFYKLFNKIMDDDYRSYTFMFKIKKIYCIENILRKYINQIKSDIECTYLSHSSNNGMISTVYYDLQKILNPEIQSIKDKLQIMTTELLINDLTSPELKFRKFFTENNNITDNEWLLFYNYALDNNLLQIIKINNQYKMKLNMSDSQTIIHNITVNLEKLNTVIDLNIKEILYKPIVAINKLKDVDFNKLGQLIRIYNYCFPKIKHFIDLRNSDFSKINNLSKFIEHFDKSKFEITIEEKEEFSELQTKFFKIFKQTNADIIKSNKKGAIFDFGEFKWTWPNTYFSQTTFKSSLPCLTESKITYYNFEKHLKILKIFGKLDIFYDQLTEYILLYS